METECLEVYKKMVYNHFKFLLINDLEPSTVYDGNFRLKLLVKHFVIPVNQYLADLRRSM